MSIYMAQWAYTPEAWAKMVKNPEDRSVAAKALIEKVGGGMLCYYNCFGEYDGLAIYEAPDETAAASVALTAIAPGHLKAFKTTILLTVEQGMEAMGKAGAISFSGPKG